MNEALSVELPVEISSKCEAKDRADQLYSKIMSYCLKRAPEVIEAFDSALMQELRRIPSPDRALLHLLRVLDTAFSPAALLDDLSRYPHLLEVFFRLVCTSTFLADVLVRDPELFRWLTATDAMAHIKPREEYRDEAREAYGRFQTPERKLNALKRFQRRELLRIAARDLLGDESLRSTTQALSWLAEAIIDTLLQEAIQTIEVRFGTRIPAPIAVLGLGKLGGEELNYSSDVDLIAVYGEDGMVTDSTTIHDLVVRVVETLIHFLSDVTSEGFLYRTDFRLRPDGNAGPLAMSLPAMLTYYESRGALWERQMLVKARIVGGDENLGQQVLMRLQPFPFPRTSFLSPSQIAADISERLRLRWDQTDNVKHCRGGIRHIEFHVQLLQLLHAPKRPEVAATGTIAAIEALAAEGLIVPGDAEGLRAAYEFLRRVEHLLQLENFEQTHTLPSAARLLDELAWKSGLTDSATFLKVLDMHRATIEKIAFMELDQSAVSAASISLSTQHLSEAGFRKPEESLRAVQSIIRGPSYRPNQSSLREELGGLMPVLIERIRGELLRDDCVKTLELLFARSPVPEALMEMMKHETARRFVLRIASMAPAVVRSIATHPIVLEAVFGGWAEDPGSGMDLWLRKLVRETNAVGRYFLEDSSFEDFLGSITRTADDCLREIYAAVVPEDAHFAVVALGKYGAQELIPGSDLDVIFLAEPTERFSLATAELCALQIIEGMQGKGPGFPRLYELDARLRPEGRNSPLVTSFDAYQRYFDGRASFWERQSLLKSRVVWGQSDFLDRVMGLIASVLGSTTIDRTAREDIITMRRKMEPLNRFRVPNFFDVKLSPGGLVDVEFALQMLQLTDGTFTDVRGGVHAVLASRTGNGKEEFQQVRNDYLFLRRVQLLFRLLLDTPSNLLPADDDNLDRLAIAMRCENSGSFLSGLDALRKRIRAFYQEIVSGI